MKKRFLRERRMKMRRVFGLVASLVVAGCGVHPEVETTGPVVHVTVDAASAREKVKPPMWGAFFEDINFGADGGLYAEMVKNRGFEFPEALMGWTLIRPSNARGEVEVRSDGTAPELREASPHYVRVTSRALPPIALSNEGFRGMGVKAGELYDFSARMRRVSGNSKVTVELIAHDGKTLGTAQVLGMKEEWSKMEAVLGSTETDGKAYLNVVVEGEGVVDLDFVSLMPEKVWKKDLPLRADMVQSLVELKPGFLRFPGGCIVEGSDLSKRYQWKNTIGPVEGRKLLINRWNYEFKHRPTPDYFQTFGLGFFEYFRLCEEIGAKPLPIINCGMACQFNSAECVPVGELEPYIQDALDLIEFANGPATSTWGAKRAAMGHAAPFGMTMMGVGNEQWGPTYIERLAAFKKVLKEKHPEITLVSDAGPSPQDERFHYLWPELRKLNAELVDEHCYANPAWFLVNAHRYDGYDRKGPKVFFGEYGAQSVAICSPRNHNTWECAIAEAAYMTGLERNGEVVTMASYAPLFANKEAWQWTPDLIWVDPLNVVPSVNYQVQQMFTHHRGDVVLKVANDAREQMLPMGGRIGVGTNRSAAVFKEIEVTTNGAVPWVLATYKNGEGMIFSDRGGTWTATKGEGILQEDPSAEAMMTTGDRAWINYTLTLKAKKRGGTEGFVITVYDDGKGSRMEWILGGWGNTKYAVQGQFAEQAELLAQMPGTIETGRWYDVKVVVGGGKMACYLDGKLMQEVSLPVRKVAAVFASATRDEGTGETIVKVVNPGREAQAVEIAVTGAKGSGTARLLQMGAEPTAENTFEKPEAVKTRELLAPVAGGRTALTVPGHSLTVVRIPGEK